MMINWCLSKFLINVYNQIEIGLLTLEKETGWEKKVFGFCFMQKNKIKKEIVSINLIPHSLDPIDQIHSQNLSCRKSVAKNRRYQVYLPKNWKLEKSKNIER